MTRDFEADQRTIDAATPGPWWNRYPNDRDGVRFDMPNVWNSVVPWTPENREFFAQSRTGWPAALEEIRRLQKRVAELEGAAKP